MDQISCWSRPRRSKLVNRAQGGQFAQCSTSSNPQRQSCRGNPIWYNPAKSGMIASGVGHRGDAKFYNNWVRQGQVATGIFLNGSNVRFVCILAHSDILVFANSIRKADLDGDGRSDYLWLNHTNGAVILYLNTGTGNKMSWAPVNGGKPIASGVGPGAGVRFADISGSGKADYLYVHDTGAVSLYQNGGPQPDGGWLWIGPKEIAAGVPNAKQDNIFFPEINGDGRAGYALVGPKGKINLWLNVGGPSSYDVSWISAGQIATGLGTPNISLSDISGDGRSDYMIWDEFGGLTGYLNVRGPQEAVPIWKDQGHSNPKAIATGVSRSSQLVNRNECDTQEAFSSLSSWEERLGSLLALAP